MSYPQRRSTPEALATSEREPHAPFSAEEMALSLNGIGNHESKALLLLTLAQGPEQMHDAQEIADMMLEGQGDDPGWKQNYRSYGDYLTRTMRPFVDTMYCDERMDADENTLYGINAVGIRAAAVATVILDWSLEFGHSPQTIFGTSHTKNDVNAPQVRFDILKALMAADPEEGLSVAELIEITGQPVQKSADRLIMHARTSDESVFGCVDPKDQELTYGINERALQDPYPHAKPIIKTIRAAIKARYEDDPESIITITDVIKIAREADPMLEPDEARKLFLKSRRPYLDEMHVRRSANGSIPSKLIIQPEAREAIKALVDRISAFTITDRPEALKHYFDVCRTRAVQITENVDDFADLMQQAYETTAAGSKTRNLVIADYLIGIMPDTADEAIGGIELTRRIKAEFGIDLNPSSIQTLLVKLVNNGIAGRAAGKYGEDGILKSGATTYFRIDSEAESSDDEKISHVDTAA